MTWTIHQYLVALDVMRNASLHLAQQFDAHGDPAAMRANVDARELLTYCRQLVLDEAEKASERGAA